MTNFEYLCSGVEVLADFIREHTSCFTCPAHSELERCEDCETAVTEWLLMEVDGD